MMEDNQIHLSWQKFVHRGAPECRLPWSTSLDGMEFRVRDQSVFFIQVTWFTPNDNQSYSDPSAMLSSGPTTSVLWYQTLESRRTAEQDRKGMQKIRLVHQLKEIIVQRGTDNRCSLTDISGRSHDFQLSTREITFVERLELPSFESAKLCLPRGFVQAIQLDEERAGLRIDWYSLGFIFGSFMNKEVPS